jgi:uncharacterized glyoxalase superfamily protein PhnB
VAAKGFRISRTRRLQRAGWQRCPRAADVGWRHDHAGFRRQATERQGIYVCVDDIDAHYAAAKSAGAEIVRELANTDYGSREYSARDLDGHLWSFGTYQPWNGS